MRIKKLILGVLCGIMVVAQMNITALAAPGNTHTDQTEIEVNLNNDQKKDEIVINIPIQSNSDEKSAKSTFSAILQVHFGRDDTISNLFHVSYTLTANSLVNGVLGTFTCSNANLINPDIYAEIPMDAAFTSTLTYTRQMGTVVVPVGVSKVRLKATGLMVYSVEHGEWESGLTFNKTYDI